MPEMLNITVRNKIATKTDNVAYVCGNSDYVINFDFDSEWDAYDTKTARFAYNGKHTDVVFTGNQCNVPVITNTYAFHVGVFAGDLHTTTAARVPCRKSILCGAGAPADPTPDVYDQLMERMAQLETSDWAQNDPTAKDYVRNRTHWVEPDIETVFLPQTEFEGTENNVSGKVYYDDYFDFTAEMPEAGAVKVKVMFDGKEYLFDTTNDNDLIVVGNKSIKLPFDDTGEPFYVWITRDYYSGHYQKQVYVCAKELGTHTVFVSCIQGVVHRLPPEYIKDMYYTEYKDGKPKVHTIPVKYIPDEVQLKADAPIVNAWVMYSIFTNTGTLDLSRFEDRVNAPFETLWIVKAVRNTGTDRCRWTHVKFFSEGDLYEIRSCRTGKPMQASEFPYGVMQLVHWGDWAYCINPI